MEKIISAPIKNNDGGSMNMQIEQVNWKLRDDVNFNWLNMTVADKNVKLVMNSKQGGRASIILNGKIAQNYPNQDKFYTGQLEIVNTGEVSGFYSTNSFYFNKSIVIEGGVFLKSPNGKLWRLAVSDIGIITAQ